MDIRTFLGANVDSDHFLVASKLRHKINRSYHKKRNNVNKNIDIEYLKNVKIVNDYRKELKSTIVVRDVAPTVEIAWQDLKQTIINASRKTIPEMQGRKNNLWFDEERSDITKKKNEAYKTMIQKHYTRAAEKRYKELRREEKRTHKKKKREYMEDLYRDIEHLKTQKEARKFYQLVNNVRADFNPRTTTCRKKNGDLMRDPDVVLVRWREHFVELLAGGESPAGICYLSKRICRTKTVLEFRKRTLAQWYAFILTRALFPSPLCSNKILIPSEMLEML
ncbi:hypothetical protein JTE90_007166 [Oedothorax gibbosus]|uniref:Uncharacterized protein n=1 Tax=Oedothorax gibbosus TaxID=931172 RepID=A0AAV6UXY0_9ARAC|nr:hypothetical protein JTE90_007166 [Oedothorax gibbosus]